MSAVAKAWNEYRAEVLREAALSQLVPLFEREHKARMLAEAKEVAITE